MPIATYRSFMGIAKEATPGVPVPPTDGIALTADPKPVDVQTMLDDKGWRGSAVATYDTVAGTRSATLGMDGNVDPTTIGYLLQSLLGDVVTTGAAAPFTHVLSTRNSADTQSTSYTLTDFDGLEARAYSAAKSEELTVAFTADGLVNFKSKWKAWASTVVTTPAIPTFSAIPPVAGWKAQVSIAGVPSLIVLDGDVVIKRPVDVLQTIDGNPDPYKLFSGPVSVTGKLSTVREDSTELNRYLQNTKPALDVLLTLDANTSIQLHLSKCAYRTAGIVRGSNYGKVDITYEGLGNVTDAGASAGFSPIKATLRNTKAAGVYA